MSKTSKMIMFVVISLLGLISIYVYTDYKHGAETKSFILSTNGVTPVVVLHRNHVIVNPNQIHQLDEEQLFLMLKKDNTLYLFTKLEQLRPYDHDHDNIIDNSDTIFHNLYIGEYDKGKKTLIYHPIEQTAIRAIRLDTDDYDQVVQGQTIYTGNHQNHSVMGMYLSTRVFHKDSFSHLKLIPRNTKITTRAS